MLLNEPRLREGMAELRLDAVVATTSENVTYMSGFWAMPQWIRRGPQSYVVWPANGEGLSEIITSTSTLDLVADQRPWIEKIRRYGDFYVEQNETPSTAVDRRHAELRNAPAHSDAIIALVAALTERGLTRGRVAIDEAGLEVGYLNEFKARLPNVTWLPAAALLRKVRAVKTVEEIERLRGAACTAERSIKAALAVAEEGVSEIALARAFHVQTVQDGAMPVLGCIGFGERSAMANVQPSDRRLHLGEVIRFDVGGRFQYYRADIARNAVLGDPSAEVRRLHRALLCGVQRACDIIRPGMLAAKVFEEVMHVVQREGIARYRRDHVGHGIGIDGYDAPSLSARSKEHIEEGMVLCIETPYYEIGRWGLQVENMVVVRSDGAESLMTTDGGLMVLTS